MANEIIRKYAKNHHISQWKIANELGYNESVFSRKLRYELPLEQQKLILSTIDKLYKKRQIEMDLSGKYEDYLASLSKEKLIALLLNGKEGQHKFTEGD